MRSATVCYATRPGYYNGTNQCSGQAEAFGLILDLKRNTSGCRMRKSSLVVGLHGGVVQTHI